MEQLYVIYSEEIASNNDRIQIENKEIKIKK